MTVNRILVDGAGIRNMYQFHRALQSAFGFPEWYGCNLDALYDCLTDIQEETWLYILNTPSLYEELGDGFDRFVHVFLDACEARPCLNLVLKA